MGDSKTKRKAKNWSKIPPEVLELILEKLDFAEIVRFKSVCSAWNRAAWSCIYFPSYRPTLPLLVLHNHKQHPEEEATNRSQFLSTFNNLLGDFGDNAWCVGSTHGWLVILDADLILHLLNPISRAEFQLPMIPQYLHEPGLFPNDYIDKTILLSDPSGGCKDNFTVVVAFREGKSLIFYDYRFNKWIHFGRPNDYYYDVIGTRQGQLYALTYKALHIWDLFGGCRRGGAYPILVKKVKYSTPLSKLVPLPNPLDALSNYTFGYHFVESLGEILLVLRCHYAMTGSRHRRMEFGVYKLDLKLKDWVTVKTLSDRALFIEANETLSVSTQDFPECQADSIYFTGLDLTGLCDVGVYNLKQGKFTRGELYPMKIYLQPPNPCCFWFVPSFMNFPK